MTESEFTGLTRKFNHVSTLCLKERTGGKGEETRVLTARRENLSVKGVDGIMFSALLLGGVDIP